MKTRVRAKVSPFGLAVHDFHDHFRRLPEGVSHYEVFKLLTDQRHERLKQFSKAFNLCIVIFVALSVSGIDTTLTVKTSFIDITVPKIYVVLLLSLLTMMSIMELLGAFLLQDFQAVAARHFSRRFPNVTVMSTPHNANGVWGHIFHARFRALVPHQSYIVGIGLSLLVVFLPVMLIYLALYALQIIHIANFFARPGEAFFGHWVAIISIVSLIAPAPLIWLSLRRISLHKNRSFLRWSFLNHIHRGLGYPAVYPSHWFD